MTVRVKLALLGVALVGVLVAAGSVAFVADPPAKSKAPDRVALVRAAAQRMFDSANRGDAKTFCHSFSEKVVKDAAGSYQQCVDAATPDVLAGYHTTNVYIAPTVVFEKGQGRARIRIDGHWFFFYYRLDSDGVWRYTNSECISCGTPGGVRSANVA